MECFDAPCTMHIPQSNAQRMCPCPQPNLNGRSVLVLNAPCTPRSMRDMHGSLGRAHSEGGRASVCGSDRGGVTTQGNGLDAASFAELQHDKDLVEQQLEEVSNEASRLQVGVCAAVQVEQNACVGHTCLSSSGRRRTTRCPVCRCASEVFQGVFWASLSSATAVVVLGLGGAAAGGGVQ
eukprot:1157932-Pelagomonas_calceolata.AAC.3